MSQVTPEQLQALIAFASKRLGMSPEQLMKTVQSGQAGGVDVRDLAEHPEKAEALMRSPQVQALLKKLGGQ